MKKVILIFAFFYILFILIGSDFIKEQGVFIDADGNKYKTVKIGEQIWMAENLKVTKDRDGNPIQSYCFNDDEKNCEKYGRLYTWDVALKLAPEGWHLPSDEEWKVLVDFLGGSNVSGKELAVGGSTGFEAFLAGGADFRGNYLYQDEYALIWSSTETSDERAYHQHVGKDGSSDHFAAMKGARISVRLLKDK